MSPLIMIIDDEAPIVTMIQEVLEDEGYQVVTALNGQSALTTLQTLQPDLILCDVMMPGMGAAGICRRLQSYPHLSDVPIILVSAAKEEQAMRDTCAYTAFLSKPFTLEALTNLVAQHIAQSAVTSGNRQLQACAK